MEDVLELYERPLSRSEPVVCIDEKPVVLHEDTCTPSPCCLDELPGATTNTSDAERQRVLAGRAQGGTAFDQR